MSEIDIEIDIAIRNGAACAFAPRGQSAKGRGTLCHCFGQSAEGLAGANEHRLLFS